MIIDQIKQANIQALKDKNQNLRSIYSVLINKHMQAVIEARANNAEVTDDDTIRIIQKTIKELSEEAENYARVNHTEEVNKINQQKQVLEAYLPKMLSEEDIKQILNTLPDKSIPTVMRHFKTEFGSTVDLKLVGQVLKTL